MLRLPDASGTEPMISDEEVITFTVAPDGWQTIIVTSKCRRGGSSRSPKAAVGGYLNLLFPCGKQLGCQFDLVRDGFVSLHELLYIAFCFYQWP